MIRFLTVVALSWLTSQLHAADPDVGQARWSPLLVGGLIGLLAAATVAISNKPLGASTAYARISGMLGRMIAPKYTRSLAYFQETVPKVDWEVALLFGVVAGGALAAWSGSGFAEGFLSATWIERFGAESQGLRVAFAVGGGFLMALGARIAGGCTSGHGISGTIQQSVGSWVSLMSFFIGGMAVALPIFGR
ncbi:MAG: YeeE/YedE thiosulfate transporter family protein [Planctomycetota bacterium]